MLVFCVLAFDSMDYAFEANFLGLKQRFSFFGAHFSCFLGLAGSLAITSLLPGLLFVIFPLFVAGSTKLFVDLAQK